MKDRINRIKQFAQDHPHLSIFTAGTLIGSGVTIIYYAKHPTLPSMVEVFIEETPEQVKTYLENHDGSLPLNLQKGKTIILHTGADLKSL